jgi:hypothetical protein
MCVLPAEVAAVLAPFAGLFSQPVWIYIQHLVCGAILTNGTRTITAILRTLGLGQFRGFENYHRVLNRDRWSAREAARLLLALLVAAFVPRGPLVIGIDELLERRRGPKISALGIYRDSARSSKSFMVKSSGLRWMSLHLLVKIPWAKRIWSLPFLTALAPSERYHQKRGQRHKKLTDWARQLIGQVRRWRPERDIVVVGDSSYAVLELLSWCVVKLNVTVITRLRLDAALYTPAPKLKPGQIGRPRKKGKRLPTLQQALNDPETTWHRLSLEWYGQPDRQIEYATGTAVWYHSGLPTVPIRWVLIRDPEGTFKPQALLSTDQNMTAKEMVMLFMRRWAMEVTFEETHAHLGLEGQRQWNDQAVARTTPCLLGLFSVVTLIANRLHSASGGKLPLLNSAWYQKQLPTFSDALAWVRWRLWREKGFWRSIPDSDVGKTVSDLFDHLSELTCRAA